MGLVWLEPREGGEKRPEREARLWGQYRHVDFILSQKGSPWRVLSRGVISPVCICRSVWWRHGWTQVEGCGVRGI